MSIFDQGRQRAAENAEAEKSKPLPYAEAVLPLVRSRIKKINGQLPELLVGLEVQSVEPDIKFTRTSYVQTGRIIKKTHAVREPDLEGWVLVNMSLLIYGDPSNSAALGLAMLTDGSVVEYSRHSSYRIEQPYEMLENNPPSFLYPEISDLIRYSSNASRYLQRDRHLREELQRHNIDCSYPWAEADRSVAQWYGFAVYFEEQLVDLVSRKLAGKP